MSGDAVQRRVTIGGDVQGVSFRASLRSQAQVFGVAGWARNTPEGTVEALLEGDPRSVARLVRWCQLGPGQASVNDVQVEEREPQGLSGFEVR